MSATNSIDQAASSLLAEVQDFLTTPRALFSFFMMVFSIVVAFWISKYIARVIIRIAQKVATRADNESDEVVAQKLRETETYLSVTVAAVRMIIVIILAWVLWRILSPKVSSSTLGGSMAAIGASAFFMVFAGQSLGLLIRDITSGAMMIIEKWFTIGDFVKFEPFGDVSGVVERMTLRSTKIRTLSGEIVWVHNQQVQGVHVSPKGVRTLAVDVFVRDRVRGEKAIGELVQAIPTGTMMLASPLRITYAERWNDTLWRISVVGQTPPGREWLVEKHFVNMIEAIDEGVEDPKQKLIVYPPIARFADVTAERKFRRAVRVNQKKRAAEKAQSRAK